MNQIVILLTWLIIETLQIEGGFVEVQTFHFTYDLNPRKLDYSFDKRVLAIRGESTTSSVTNIYLRNGTRSYLQQIIKSGNESLAISLSKSHKVLLLATSDSVKVLTFDQLELKYAESSTISLQNIQSLTISSDSTLIAIGRSTGQIQLFQQAGQNYTSTDSLYYTDTSINCIVMTDDNSTLVASSADNLIRVYRKINFKYHIVQTLSEAIANLQSLDISWDGQTIVVASGKSLRVYQLDTNFNYYLSQTLQDRNENFAKVQISQDKTTIIGLKSRQTNVFRYSNDDQSYLKSYGYSLQDSVIIGARLSNDELVLVTQTGDVYVYKDTECNQGQQFDGEKCVESGYSLIIIFVSAFVGAIISLGISAVLYRLKFVGNLKETNQQHKLEDPMVNQQSKQ